MNFRPWNVCMTSLRCSAGCQAQIMCAMLECAERPCLVDLVSGYGERRLSAVTIVIRKSGLSIARSPSGVARSRVGPMLQLFLRWWHRCVPPALMEKRTHWTTQGCTALRQSADRKSRKDNQRASSAFEKIGSLRISQADLTPLSLNLHFACAQGTRRDDTTVQARLHEVSSQEVPAR